jgi:hypothetical protein
VKYEQILIVTNPRKASRINLKHNEGNWRENTAKKPLRRRLRVKEEKCQTWGQKTEKQNSDNQTESIKDTNLLTNRITSKDRIAH